MSWEDSEHWSRIWELSTFICTCEMEGDGGCWAAGSQTVDVLVYLKFIFFKQHLIFPETGIKSVGDTEAGTL